VANSSLVGGSDSGQTDASVEERSAEHVADAHATIGRPVARSPTGRDPAFPAATRKRDDRVVRVTTLGTGDAFGSCGRFQTCIAFAVDSADAPRVLLDCGASSLTDWFNHRRL